MPLTLRMDPHRQGDGAAHAVPPPGASGAKAGHARRCPTCAQAFSGEARFCPFDGDALVEAPDWNPSADPLIGQIVDGRYEVAGVIGEGGMGTVYEVRHVTLGRRFALKVLRRDIADAEHTARFIQEAKAAAAIGHPNIVAVSDFGELPLSMLPPLSCPPPPSDSSPGSADRPSGATKVPYFVMEYLQGISLAALLRAERTLDPLRAGEIALQCASGLSAAHAAGVVHRDLKPDNVFLTRSADREFVKLLDFGVAKMAGAGRLTRAGMVFGTPHYMSPEQAAGQAVDLRADIYALGVILYECLAGKVPFEADTYMGVLTKHMFATPEPIDRVAPDASKLGALGPICMRCLAKSPQDRYSSMTEVAAAIEQALAEAGIARPGAMLRSERPPAAARRRDAPRDTGDLDSAVTPGLKPVVGPVGYGLGGLALALLVLLGVRELRGAPSQGPPAPLPATAAEASSPAPATAAPPAAPPPSPVATASPTAEPRPDPSGATPQATSSPEAAKPRPAPPVRPSVDRHKTRPRSGGDVVDPWK